MTNKANKALLVLWAMLPIFIVGIIGHLQFIQFGYNSLIVGLIGNKKPLSYIIILLLYNNAFIMANNR